MSWAETILAELGPRAERHGIALDVTIDERGDYVVTGKREQDVEAVTMRPSLIQCAHDRGWRDALFSNVITNIVQAIRFKDLQRNPPPPWEKQADEFVMTSVAKYGPGLFG